MTTLRVLVSDADGKCFLKFITVGEKPTHDSAPPELSTDGCSEPQPITYDKTLHDGTTNGMCTGDSTGADCAGLCACNLIGSGAGDGGPAAGVARARAGRYGMSAMLAGLVVRELTLCPRVRAAVWRHNAGTVQLRVTKLGRAPLDARWGLMLQHLLWQRRELDYMMSWLSTLGGAFSALGDYYTHCSEIAGRISVKQLELALRLADPTTVARCKLYAAISLLQRGRFETAAALVRQQYRLPEARRDSRLRNMCRGIWAKLVYERHRQAALTVFTSR